MLGAARDAEVQHQRLAPAHRRRSRHGLAMGPVRTTSRPRPLATAYRHAHAVSLEAMQTERYDTLIDNLGALVVYPPWTPLADQSAVDVLPARVAKEFKRLRRRVAAVESAPDRQIQDERLHEVRKAAKRARYAAEPLIPIFGRDADRFAKAIESVQIVLGDYQDAVVTQPLLRELAIHAHLDGSAYSLLGRLHAASTSPHGRPACQWNTRGSGLRRIERSGAAPGSPKPFVPGRRARRCGSTSASAGRFARRPPFPERLPGCGRPDTQTGQAKPQLKSTRVTSNGPQPFAHRLGGRLVLAFRSLERRRIRPLPSVAVVVTS